MQLIQNNPYRIVGLLVGATAKEQSKQINRLKQYIDTDQEPQPDYSLPILGNLHRTLESVNEAASKLNLDSDRMHAALFWFFIGNTITDEPAIDALKEADQKNSKEIWSKLTASGEINQRNSSAFHNLSTLLLCSAFDGSTINTDLLEKSISLKLRFLECDYVKDLQAKATDETYKVSKKDLQLIFLNQVQSELNINGGINPNKFLELVNKQEFIAKHDFFNGFVQKPIEFIEKKIEETKKKVKENKSKGGEYGNELYNSTKDSLSQIKSILGPSDIKFISISDKLANEILQSSIILFNHFHGSETEVADVSVKLNEKAKSIALGSLVKQRINESSLIVEKYAQDRPKREKQKIVSVDLKFIEDKLQKFQSLNGTIPNAVNFANSCKPYLDNMKLKLGENDELYIIISTKVTSNAQGMIISTVNDAMDKRNKYVQYFNYQNDPVRNLILHRRNWTTIDVPGQKNTGIPYAPNYSIDELKNVISESWRATVKLGSFDMSVKQMEYYTKNKDILRSVYKKLFDDIVFLGDLAVNKLILWVVGIIGFVMLLVTTCK